MFGVKQIHRNVRVPEGANGTPESINDAAGIGALVKQMGMDFTEYTEFQKNNFWETCDMAEAIDAQGKPLGWVPVRFGKVALCLPNGGKVVEFIYNKVQGEYLQFPKAGPTTNDAKMVSFDYRFQLKPIQVKVGEEKPTPCPEGCKPPSKDEKKKKKSSKDTKPDPDACPKCQGTGLVKGKEH